MAGRAFVMLPLAELAPTWRHPISGERAGDLAAALVGEGPARPAWPVGIPLGRGGKRLYITQSLAHL